MPGPALDVLNRALLGDHSSISFLDRTSSIYVLDATDASKPKTYGGWNFIHQAMNEIERSEAAHPSNGAPPHLTGHVQLLATIAQKMARRSPMADRNLVATCISNASQYHPSDVEARSLIDLNSEIREIVMGRIAAMAFDFSFHHHGNVHRSAFSDNVAMEKLCAVLAANAVSSGPHAVNHFMKEWIIPSVTTLPPFAVACVTYHLAIEAHSKTSPSGTKDMLQSLSYPVVGTVLSPVLSEAIGETSDSPDHEQNCRVAAIALRALERWCSVTDLSLPQIRHICSKNHSDFVSIISDALYSDSAHVVEAMSDLLDVCVNCEDEGTVSQQRMTQARYIMAVDEDVFRSISAEDLYRIEVKEMEEVLGDLVTAIGLQRFRFSERQAKGDHTFCRNLTGIAAKVGSAAMDGLVAGQITGNGSGLVELLMKAGGHPHVHISSLAIETLSRLLPLDPSFSTRLLPLLQHRAIIPYVLHGSAPSVAATSISGVDFHEFEKFRQNILVEALVSCYEHNPKYYMDSCTSAVEEFCSSVSTVEVSFQLEAALFCLTAVSIPANAPSKREGKGDEIHNQQLVRCTSALSTKPAFLPANPLALAQLNKFFAMYGSWYTSNAPHQALDVAFELSVSTISMSATAFSDQEPATDMLKEMAFSPFSEAARATKILLTRSPLHFATPHAIASLGTAWEMTFTASNRGRLAIEDREEICKGICCLVAALPLELRAKPYHGFALPVVDRLHSMTNHVDGLRDTANGEFKIVIPKLADEIRLLSTMVHSFAGKVQRECSSNIDDSALTPSVDLLKKLWPCLTHIASVYSTDKNVADALGYFLVGCIPPALNCDDCLELLKELFILASSMIQESDRRGASTLAVYEFIERVMDVHGTAIEHAAQAGVENEETVDQSDPLLEAGRLLEDLLLSSVLNIRDSLGSAWTRDKEQGQGQLPFESKNEPQSEIKPASTELLAAVLNALNVAVNACPTFLVHLPARPCGDSENDRLLYRAVESSVAALMEPDFEAARTAILFLNSTMDLLAKTESQTLKIELESIVSRVRGTIVYILIAGICGGLHPTLLDPAATLLYTVIRNSTEEEAKSYYESGLLQEQFRLGETARLSCAKFLAGCSSGDRANVELMDLAAELWELHQHNEVDDLAESDQVVALVHKLSKH